MVDSNLIENLKENPVDTIAALNYKLEYLSELDKGFVLACLVNKALSDSSIITATIEQNGKEINDCFISMSLANENFNSWFTENMTLEDEFEEEIENFRKDIPHNLSEYFNREDVAPLKENKIFVMKIIVVYAFSDSTLGKSLGPRGIEANNFIKSCFINGDEEFLRENIESYINSTVTVCADDDSEKNEEILDVTE